MRTVLGCAIVAAALLVGLASAAGAEGQAWDGADHGVLVAQQIPPAAVPATPGDRLRRALGLSEEQARRVDQILTAHRARTAQLRIDLARAHLDAREALLAASPDRARLDAVARRVGELQGQLTAARYGMLVEVRAVLTPEQWTRFQGMMLRGPAVGPGSMRGRLRR
ncbi:MAG: Spy/CpxP family protein refolding chaperone [Armatimonadota bacterium]|nr:Spy/CpxP family protein refolding chaperone [Armatimonadota bacterium]MDR7421152.1 Spy/CpxP family protein refolding chaperone [Armatimonadota bacterium]MDR7453467.1 Spy/CpxP family protein refolding chaperone [Armatimonadota bacterium]MDR7457249.1 Spy/CpxP family protein refolding chaperone [Armatimonadota bacterium]MDR7496102.1 Spy/CpxP family protein refolding chaperone [Armatimonadota bacterium]